jgi:hypothetical protein
LHFLKLLQGASIGLCIIELIFLLILTLTTFCFSFQSLELFALRQEIADGAFSTEEMRLTSAGDGIARR